MEGQKEILLFSEKYHVHPDPMHAYSGAEANTLRLSKSVYDHSLCFL